MSKKWDQAQKWESNWWGQSLNTFGEEMKQLLYANRMGLQFFHDKKSPYNINAEQKKILDIGGGPASLLLKCQNLKKGKVIDPLSVSKWVKIRYQTAGIDFKQIQAEKMKEKSWDEVWIYNVLQHCENPEKVIKNSRKAGKMIRIFEWLETGTNIGHLHDLTKKKLDKWLQGKGKVEQLKGQNSCFGKAYYGVFI